MSGIRRRMMLERYQDESDEDFEARQAEAEAQGADESAAGPQALLDEHVYSTPVSTDIRVTHVAMTEAEELAAAEDQPPPPDTTEGGLSREGDDNRGYDDRRRDDYNRG